MSPHRLYKRPEGFQCLTGPSDAQVKECVKRTRCERAGSALLGSLPMCDAPRADRSSMSVLIVLMIVQVLLELFPSHYRDA